MTIQMRVVSFPNLIYLCAEEIALKLVKLIKWIKTEKSGFYTNCFKMYEVSKIHKSFK